MPLIPAHFVGINDDSALKPANCWNNTDCQKIDKELVCSEHECTCNPDTSVEYPGSYTKCILHTLNSGETCQFSSQCHEYFGESSSCNQDEKCACDKEHHLLSDTQHYNLIGIKNTNIYYCKKICQSNADCTQNEFESHCLPLDSSNPDVKVCRLELISSTTTSPEKNDEVIDKSTWIDVIKVIAIWVGAFLLCLVIIVLMLFIIRVIWVVVIRNGEFRDIFVNISDSAETRAMRRQNN